MGKTAEIRKVKYSYGFEEEVLEGILVVANVDRFAATHDACYIRNIKDKEDVIRLDPAESLIPNICDGRKLNETGVILLGPNTSKEAIQG